MPHSLGTMIARVFLPFAFGYFLSYLYRVVNAVIAPDLARDLGLGPDILGVLTASYFITFAAFQLPLGVLLDKYGSRRVEASLLIFAALGALFFATATSSADLIIGRALIGFGVSACLMAAFKAFSLFYKPDQLPLVNGFIMAAGGLGALAGTAPTEWVVQAWGWRGGFYGLAGLTLLCALCVYWAVPESKNQRAARPQQSFKEQLSGIKTIFTSPVFWSIAPITMMSQASFITIQSLWVGPWHRDVAMLERGAVADTLFGIAAAMVVGFLGIGALATALKKYGISPKAVAGSGVLLFMLAQGGIIAGWATDYSILWIAFGCFGTTGIVNYAILAQNFPAALSGRINTAINLMVFVTIFILQSVSGYLITYWNTASDDHYSPNAYTNTFMVFLGLQAIAFLWSLRPLPQKAAPLIDEIPSP